MYIPKRKVVCAMISEIDFKVKGEKRKKLAYKRAREIISVNSTL